MILEAAWLGTAQQVIALITGLVGLIGTAIGAFFAIRNWIKLTKEKSAKEIWNTIVSMADAAMKEAEASGKAGADKKQMVIDSVKAGCKAAGLNIDEFLDQLSAYIDQCIDFANSINEQKK